MALFDRPPAAFNFSVSLSGATGESSFQEVSGLKAQWTTEDVAEGGQNRFVHKLPLRTRFDNVVLKRGVITRKSKLADWLTASFRADFTAGRVHPKSIVILLLDAAQQPILKWWLAGAYPVAWDHSTLSSMESNLLIETVELSYAFFERSVVRGESNAA
jgi:phage tail-like protein